MDNQKRMAKLLEIATEALKVVWPDDVRVEDHGTDFSGVPEYKVYLARTKALADRADETFTATLPEMFQYIAGIAADYRPDYHWVYDTHRRQVRVIDTVDYTQKQLIERFHPLAELETGEKYLGPVKDKSGAIFIQKRLKSGRVDRIRLDIVRPDEQPQQQ